MVVKVLLSPSGKSFLAEESETILNAALRSGITLNHNCKNGSCGACKAKILSGSVECINGNVIHSDTTQQDILTCCSVPKSNIELETDYIDELNDIKPSIFVSKLDELFINSHADTAILKLRLHPSVKLRFLSGQYINLLLNGVKRSYSIASVSDEYVELHIRQVKDGVFSKIIFNELKVGQVLRFEGPYGTFFVRKDSRPLLFIAGGTGFAPIKSMVDNLIKNNDTRPIHIYWGVTKKDYFYIDQIDNYFKAYSHIQFTPVVLEHDVSWKGKTGVVHKVILDDFTDLSPFSIYASGSAEMISAVYHEFMLNKMNKKYFFSDAFVPSN